MKLQTYLDKRGIGDAQMEQARQRTREYIDAYNLREARKSARLTQVQLAQAMGVSQNRVSRMENGDLSTMSIDSVRRYVEALGGAIELVAKLPNGDIRLA